MGFLITGAALAVSLCLPAAQAPQGVNADAKTLADFQARVAAYVAMHQKLEATLPNLPKEATPQQIDANQRKLLALIQSARTGAARGDLFTPGMTAFVKRVLADVFAGPQGRQLRNSIMDENVKELPLTVNQRYPDGIPLASMPPALLKALPTLPEGLEYRFVASQLVLLDPHAHLVADFIPGAFAVR